MELQSTQYMTPIPTNQSTAPLMTPKPAPAYTPAPLMTPKPAPLYTPAPQMSVAPTVYTVQPTVKAPAAPAPVSAATQQLQQEAANINATGSATLPTQTDTTTTPAAPTQPSVEDILKQYGVTPNPSTGSDFSAFTDLYKNLHNQLGLTDIQGSYKDLVNQQQSLTDEMNTKIQDVNDNPWLSEGARQARVQSIKNNYSGKLDSLVQRQQQLQGLYNQGQQEAQFLTSQYLNQQGRAQDFNDQIRAKAIETAIAQATAQPSAPSANVAEYQYAQQNGYTGSYFDYLREKTAATSTATGGAAGAAGAGTPAGQQFKTEANQRIIDSIDSISNAIDNGTAGFLGGVESRIPGTKAYNLNQQLQTIKSNIAFTTLQDMRDASKTGGALGQVSDREEALLSSVLGSLDIGQSPDQLKKNLANVRDIVSKWNDAVAQNGGSTGTSGTGSDTGDFTSW